MRGTTTYRFAALLSLLVALLLIAACGSQPNVATEASPALQPTQATAAEPTAETAQTAGELVVYSVRAEALFNPVIEAFNKLYPNVKVTVLTGKNGELAAKILEERANPQADLLITTDNLTIAGLEPEGVLVPMNVPAVQAVPEAYRAADGSWFALTMRPRVIMYNTDLVQADELPTSLLDLSDPKWKGQVGAADSTNGAMMANLVAMRHLLGAEQTGSFVQGLVDNETQFFGSHTDVRKAVGAGELKLGFVNHYYYHLSKAEGAPVAVIYPDQGEGQTGLFLNTTNGGVVKGGPNPDAARLFVEFMLSPQGQQIYAEKNFEYPIVAEVPLAAGVPPLSEFKLAEVSLKTMWDELEPTKELALGAGLP